MGNLRAFVVTLVFTVAILASPAGATIQGKIGVYFDTGATSQDAAVEVNEEFLLHITLTEVNNAFQAVEWQVNLPAEIIILEETYWDGSLPFFAPGGGNASDGVRLGMGECVRSFPGEQEIAVAVTLRLMAISEFTSRVIGVTEYPGQGGVFLPRYTTCGANPEFFELQPGFGTLEATAVPVAESSWGGVKALYQ